MITLGWCNINNKGMECLTKLILPRLKNINLCTYIEYYKASNDFNSESL